MTYIPEALRRQIAVRANFHCEYCLTGQINRTKPHEVDHIYAEKHGGATVAENLCLSCYYCNRYKGSDLCGLDPETGEPVMLFHPRRQEWGTHFRMDAGRITWLSPTGYATIYLLQMNDPLQVIERELWSQLDDEL